MNGALLLASIAVLFAVAYRVYGRFLTRLFGVDADRKTPSWTNRDGVDYVPTRSPVVFGHHFASIAGAGPIVGPIAAAYFGWLPVVLWIVIGCIFIGGVHDFASLFLSVRKQGRSIGHIVEEYIGYAGRPIFLMFSWATLILVVAVFTILVAKTFVSNPAAATASLLFIGISPIFGWLVYKRQVRLWAASAVFVPLVFLSVWVGGQFPCELTRLAGISAVSAQRTWVAILLVYAFVASVIPVWTLLQPRDYLNSYLLYAMMLVGFVSVLVAAPVMRAPVFVGWSVMRPEGLSKLFPLLFVTVACGACSGFHSLVSSGTTSKQVDSERSILRIGYGAMLVEGLLAAMSLISIAYLTREGMAEALKAGGGPVGAFSAGLSHFATRVGLAEETGRTFFSLVISAFLLTTLDTATRLTRFAWQEMFLPRRAAESKPVGRAAGLLGNRYLATSVVVVLAGYLAFSGDYRSIWPVFGASNQLLAALSLLAITLVLIRWKRNFLVTLVPMLFMLLVCVWALSQLLLANWGRNTALVTATGFLLLMSVGLVVQAARSPRRAREQT